LVSNLKLVSNHHSDLVCWNDLVSKNLCKQGRKEAKKAWLIAGVLNGPLWHLWGDFRNASKVAATQGMFDGVTDAATMDSEMGLPVLLATILPIGLMGLAIILFLSNIVYC
jgi:SSS family solute:Na+ symporter